jgi:hypothetical protein
MKYSIKSATSLVFCAFALAGCGGGSDNGLNEANGSGSNPGGSQIQADNDVPDSAWSSGSAFIGFLKTMALNNETSEPMTMRETSAVPEDNTGDPEPRG